MLRSLLLLASQAQLSFKCMHVAVAFQCAKFHAHPIICFAVSINLAGVNFRFKNLRCAESDTFNFGFDHIFPFRDYNPHS